MAQNVFGSDLPGKLEMDKGFNSGKVYYISRLVPPIVEAAPSEQESFDHDLLIGGNCVIIKDEKPKIPKDVPEPVGKKFYEGLFSPEQEDLVAELFYLYSIICNNYSSQ